MSEQEIGNTSPDQIKRVVVGSQKGGRRTFITTSGISEGGLTRSADVQVKGVVNTPHGARRKIVLRTPR